MSTDREKVWVCVVCGYIHRGPEPPDECPVCGADATQFEEEAAPSPKVAASAVWVCLVCGYEESGPEPPGECPQCGAGPDDFEKKAAASEQAPKADPNAVDPEYLGAWRRDRDEAEPRMARIQQQALTGTGEITAMRTRREVPGWEAVLFKGAQLHRLPLNEDEPVSLRTVLGPGARKPVTLELPFYVLHMSFGALSREAKMALARGAKRVGTAMGSGEGGLLPEERAEAGIYIYEIGTADFSWREDAVRQADAVEIKIGQAAKPGLGGHLPKAKITPEIAAIRGIPSDRDAVSPGRPFHLKAPGDLAATVARLREWIDGRPVGVKIAACHIEEDLEIALAAGPDFITVDCRGGGTGAGPVFVKDNTCLPPVYAVHRARRFLDNAGTGVTLCVTGGFRDSADIAKALALGADAVALATASLMAIGCQQYRVCHTGKCPVGITTQDPALRARLDVEQSARRFVNFASVLRHELEAFARINGRADIHDLDRLDLVTTSDDLTRHAGIEHV
ncbi:MAG: glutamate synthase [Candidatus Hydrogenedens sp.]|nr:glutamate synthase [Candidatus Hydrogenedens sp.]